jgi:hypothetical protein
MKLTALLTLPFLFLSPWPIAALTPLLALAVSSLPLLDALWIALGCGLLLDLLANTHFGLLALTTCLTTALLYPYRHHLVADRWYALPVLTALYSSLSTFLLFLLLNLYNQGFPLAPRWILTDLLLLPAADGAYCLLIVTLPLTLLLKKPWRQRAYRMPRPK